MKKLKYSIYKNFFLFKLGIPELSFTLINLRSLHLNFMSQNTFESMRRFISRKVKKKIKYKFFKAPLRVPLYKKPNKTRMGKGVGKFYLWLWKICKNQSLFELSYLKKKFLFFYIFSKLKYKIPFKVFLSSI